MRNGARKKILLALDLPLTERFGEGRYVLSTAEHLHDAAEFELAIAAVTTAGVASAGHELLKYPIHVDKAPLFAPSSAAERKLPSYATLQEAQVDEVQRTLHAGLAHAVKDFSPDIVHVHHAFLLVPAAAALGAIWSVPFIVTAHGVEMKTAARDRRYADLVGPSLRRASGVTAVSAAVRRDLGHLFGHGIEGGVHVVPGGVDTEAFHPETVSEEARADLNRDNGLEKETKVALFVGALTPEKGVDVLLDAAERSKDVEFRLVGETREDKRGQSIQDRIEASDNVQVLPSLAPEALVEWYVRADVLVMPSLDEGFGLVALEAMACGTPVVVSRSEAMESIVQDGVNGYLVPPGQPFALSRAINKAVNDPRRSSMGERARDTVELRYSWPTITDMLRPIYRQALGPPLPFAAQ